MFERLGNFVVRRRVVVLVLTGMFLLAAGAIGGGVAERLSQGGFDDPGAESTLAADLLLEEFDQQDPNLILLVQGRTGTANDPEIVEAGRALAAKLEADPEVEKVVSYWDTNSPALISRDEKQALIMGVIPGEQDEVITSVKEVSPRFQDYEDPAIDVTVTGMAEVFRQMQHQIEGDLVRAEAVALPLTLIALIFVFGSIVAASLPLAVGILAIIGTFLALTVIAELTEVSIFSLNLTTAMGLGLAIDYSLFIVSRYREELGKGLAVREAVVETVRTAGRTVAFSGFTVAISLSALLIFPMAFLRSFAYAGVAVVLLAALVSTTFLPALLAVLGHRVDKGRIFKRQPKPVGEGFWHRLAMSVMRRPISIASVVIVLLVLLGSPFIGVDFGSTDDRALPESATSRGGLDEIRQNFEINGANGLNLVASEAGDPQGMGDEIDAYSARLSDLSGVYAVESLTGTYATGDQVAPPDPSSQRFAGSTGTWVHVVPAVEAFSPEGEELVRAVRDVEAPFEFRLGGASAELVDSKESIFDRVPLAAILIGVATFVLLFLMFGGLLVPVKAIVLNLLSLSATFGAMVWIFQDGNLSGVLNFTPLGFLDTTTPILMFCIAFGLSMDYEVFLLSRIKEEHDLTGDNTSSVAMGLERTGRIVTAAALILSIVFIAFGTSGVSFIKMFGIGLALAVIMDASLVRGTLVPAFMRLAGEANWWAPSWLRRIQERVGISESARPLPPKTTTDVAPSEVS
jgi:RND superfamily putative drug exporter